LLSTTGRPAPRPEVLKHYDGRIRVLNQQNRGPAASAAPRLMLTDAQARARIAARGQQPVATNYSWRDTAAEAADLYRDCLGQKANRHGSEKTVSERRDRPA
jgi:hypothetical protein